MRLKDETQPVRAGDTIMHPAGEAHQISNTGMDELVYFIIADNPPLDFCHYPDSDKSMASPGEGFYRRAGSDYWEGEE